MLLVRRISLKVYLHGRLRNFGPKLSLFIRGMLLVRRISLKVYLHGRLRNFGSKLSLFIRGMLLVRRISLKVYLHGRLRNLFAEVPGKCCVLLFVPGSIRLSDDCLNDGSRGRRPFASLSALLYMCERSLCLVLRWTASTLDESILTDRRRRHVFQSFYNTNYFIRMFNKINTFFLLGVILF